MIVCPECGAEVYNGRKHKAWHEQYDSMTDVLEARLVLLEAHSENHIERLHELEGGDAVYEALADEAERGYDHLHPRSFLLLAIDPNGRLRSALTTTPEVPDSWVGPGEVGFLLSPIDLRARHGHGLGHE